MHGIQQRARPSLQNREPGARTETPGDPREGRGDRKILGCVAGPFTIPMGMCSAAAQLGPAPLLRSQER